MSIRERVRKMMQDLRVGGGRCTRRKVGEKREEKGEKGEGKEGW